MATQSPFDGESFTSALRLSGRAFDSKIGFGGGRDLPDIGSRLGLVSADDGALAVWTDTRAGTEVSRKQDLFAARVAFSRPDRLDGPGEAVLRYGGKSRVKARPRP